MGADPVREGQRVRGHLIVVELTQGGPVVGRHAVVLLGHSTHAAASTATGKGQ